MVAPLRTESTDVGVAPGSARAAIPRTPGVIAAEKRFESWRVAVLVALAAYGGIGMFTEWWPIGLGPGPRRRRAGHPGEPGPATSAGGGSYARACP